LKKQNTLLKVKKKKTLVTSVFFVYFILKRHLNFDPKFLADIRYPASPDIRYPAKSVSGASLISMNVGFSR
jgi:hypothetical protein